MNQINIGEQTYPYKLTNGARMKFEKTYKVRLANLGNEILTEHMVALAFYAIEAGCHLENKTFPWKTIDEFVLADAEHDLVDHIWENLENQEKK